MKWEAKGHFTWTSFMNYPKEQQSFCDCSSSVDDRHLCLISSSADDVQFVRLLLLIGQNLIEEGKIRSAIIKYDFRNVRRYLLDVFLVLFEEFICSVVGGFDDHTNFFIDDLCRLLTVRFIENHFTRLRHIERHVTNTITHSQLSNLSTYRKTCYQYDHSFPTEQPINISKDMLPIRSLIPN